MAEENGDDEMTADSGECDMGSGRYIDESMTDGCRVEKRRHVKECS